MLDITSLRRLGTHRDEKMAMRTWQSKRSVMPPWPGMVSPKSLSSNALLKPLAKNPPARDVNSPDKCLTDVQRTSLVLYFNHIRLQMMKGNGKQGPDSPNGDIRDAKQAMEIACSCTGMAVTDHVEIVSHR